MQEWTCPYCGGINKEKDTRGRVFAFACRGVIVTENGKHMCGARLVFAMIAYTMPRGRLVPPPDKVIPEGLAEAFPEGELKQGLWKSGRACNILVVSPDELPEVPS